MKTLLLLSLVLVLLAGCGCRRCKSADDFDRDSTFIFQELDRRDPFSFVRKLPTILEPQTPGTDPVDTQKLDPARVAQKRMEALTHYNLAEQSFMDENAADALQHCDKGLEVFRDVEISKYRELQEIRDQIMRLRKAAERSKQRVEVAREFEMMNLKLTGVVARNRTSQAIINALVVGKGDVVNETVIVSDILPGNVIVLFHGYRLILSVQK